MIRNGQEIENRLPKPVQSESQEDAVAEAVVQANQKAEPSESSSESEEEEADDLIFAEWTKINRTKNKFKCEFKNVVLKLRGVDYVIKNLNGDIEY